MSFDYGGEIRVSDIDRLWRGSASKGFVSDVQTAGFSLRRPSCRFNQSYPKLTSHSERLLPRVLKLLVEQATSAAPL